MTRPWRLQFPEAIHHLASWGNYRQTVATWAEQALEDRREKEPRLRQAFQTLAEY